MSIRQNSQYRRFTLLVFFALFVLFISVCLNLTGCKKDKVSRDVFGYVEGTVIDSLTRFPIDSAWISVTPDTSVAPITYTDSSGLYGFVDFAGNRFSLYCGKKKYITKKSKEFQIQKNKTTRIDFELVPLKEQGG